MKVQAMMLIRTAIVLSAAMMPHFSWANAIVNGDFEDLTNWGPLGEFSPPPGWSLPIGEASPVSQQTGATAIGGSGTSARFRGAENMFHIEQVQDFSSPWVFDFDFAAEDAGGSAGRTVDLALTLAENGNIFMRVVDVGDNGVGDIQFHDASGGWTSVAGLADSVIFSSDVAVSHSLNHVKIVSDFGQATPSYDAIVTNENGQFTALGINLFSFFDLPPQNGGAITKVAFFESLTTDAEWLLDNVALTAGTSPSLIGDYNDNGIVDAADYAIWRDGGALQNDPTEGVQPEDYDVWRANFGHSLGTGSGSAVGGTAAVPEPASLGLFLLGAAVSMLTMKQRRQ